MFKFTLYFDFLIALKFYVLKKLCGLRLINQFINNFEKNFLLHYLYF